MKNLNYPLFFLTMMLGIIITLSASSWLTAWVGLELNLLGFLPLMMNKEKLASYEMITKYFLISSISSLMLLFFTLSFWKFNSILFNPQLINLALGIKLGSAPFHLWFISFMKTISHENAFLLMTTQKLPPLFLMAHYPAPLVITSFIILSSIIGSLSGLHQTSILKIMAYSSVSHLAWMMTCILSINQMWITYFIIYILMMGPILFFLKKTQMWDLSASLNLSFQHMVFFTLSLLSLAGLPPLLGFFPKLFILFQLFYMNHLIIFFILVFTSLFSTYFYIRILYQNLLIFLTNNPKPMPNFPLQASLLFSIMSPLLFMWM